MAATGMPKGKNELAVLITLRSLGISVKTPGKWAAQVALARLLAQELDSGENISAALVAQYRSVLGDLTRSKVVADGADKGRVLRQLRSV